MEQDKIMIKKIIIFFVIISLFLPILGRISLAVDNNSSIKDLEGIIDTERMKENKTFKDLTEKIEAFLESIFQEIKENPKGFFINIWDNIKNFFENTFGVSIKEAFNKIAGWFKWLAERFKELNDQQEEVVLQ